MRQAKAMETPDISRFAGRWQITRRIEDALAGQVLHFDGDAVIAPKGEGFLYSESGLLHAPGQAPMRGERRYHWCADDRGIVVRFEDGRYFHRIGAGEGPADTHDCPPDLYRVTYDFRAWPTWHAVWRVSGPRKNYVMDSRYTPG